MKVLIGWAEESLVPDKKVSLSGQFFERISEGVESEICATAMAVESDGEQMIMVSVDMEGFPEALVRLAREKFARLTDEIDPRKLIISATHTCCNEGCRAWYSEVKERSVSRCQSGFVRRIFTPR